MWPFLDFQPHAKHVIHLLSHRKHVCCDTWLFQDTKPGSFTGHFCYTAALWRVICIRDKSFVPVLRLDPPKDVANKDMTFIGPDAQADPAPSPQIIWSSLRVKKEWFSTWNIKYQSNKVYHQEGALKRPTKGKYHWEPRANSRVSSASCDISLQYMMDN